MAEGLIRIGVIKQNLEEALGPEGELSNWYMHNTGHWLEWMFMMWEYTGQTIDARVLKREWS